MSKCIDVRDFRNYRAYHEAENRRAHKIDDPWELILPGARGFVAPWGVDTLVACTDSRGKGYSILASVTGSVCVANGSDGMNVKFHAKYLESVAKILRLRRRRQLTEEQKAKSRERLARYHFSSAVQSPES